VLILLALITLFGGGLRFLYLTKPDLWGDEAATFIRVCGTFQELVDVLAVRGLFTPLHYLLYWWIGQHTPLTPLVMRLPVAIAGTLMIPAMYFLAVQLVPRRTALLIALFTACSAFMLNFSRDAKMYADLWLFVALHVGCLLWWLRTRTRVRWWAWVCTGVIMVGLQAESAIVLVIELLIVITSRRQHWRSLAALLVGVVWVPIAAVLSLLPLMKVRWRAERCALGRAVQWLFNDFHWPPLVFYVIGIAIILVGPWLWHSRFSVRAERVYRPGSGELNWTATGIFWLGPYNEGRDGFDLTRYAATAFLYNWEWPRLVDQPEVRERTLKLLKWAGIALFALLAIGLLPWRRHVDSEAAHGPPARGWLWLTLWIVLPAYGFYCASESKAAWPLDWLIWAFLRQPLNWHGMKAREIVSAVTLSSVNWWAVIAVAGLLLWCLLRPPLDWRRKLRHTAAAIAVLALVFVSCTMLRWAFANPLPDSVWLPRYLGFTWPAFAIVVCVLLMRLPTRPLRWGAIGLLLIVNLAQHGARIFAGSEPPTGLMAADLLNVQQHSDDTAMFYRILYRGKGDPGSGSLTTPPGRYYIAVLSGRKTSPEAMLTPAVVDGWYRSLNDILLPLETFVPLNLLSRPQVQKLVVWDQLNPGQVDQVDKLLEKLSPIGWKRISEAEYHVRDHWPWRDLYTARRRVYVRTPEPATRPS
jgi:4-amino-4-deoxy-L-arabinose transferase-like glycosyltransferase